MILTAASQLLLKLINLKAMQYINVGKFLLNTTSIDQVLYF
jgi:hypothetical protein